MTQFHTRPNQIEMSDLLKDYLLRIGIVEEVFCVVSLFGMLFGALDSAWGKLLWGVGRLPKTKTSSKKGLNQNRLNP